MIFIRTSCCISAASFRSRVILNARLKIRSVYRRIKVSRLGLSPCWLSRMRSSSQGISLHCSIVVLFKACPQGHLFTAKGSFSVKIRQYEDGSVTIKRKYFWGESQTELGTIFMV